MLNGQLPVVGGSVSEWLSELVSGWVGGQVGGWVCLSGWVSDWVGMRGLVAGWVCQYQWVSGWLSDWVSEWMNEWVSEWVNMHHWHLSDKTVITITLEGFLPPKPSFTNSIFPKAFVDIFFISVSAFHSSGDIFPVFRSLATSLTPA